MELRHPRAVGIDIGKESATVAVRIAGADGSCSSTVTTCGSMTGQVLDLIDTLTSLRPTVVVMEATSDYWKPFYYPMEAAGLPVMLVNPSQVKGFPKDKTDVADAVKLADLAAHGLLRASFVPTLEIRQLRDLTRARQLVTKDRSRVKQRLEKFLESASIKLSVVVNDLTGVSAKRMLAALVDGERDTVVLAGLALGRMRSKSELLEAALTGHFTEHHAFVVGELLHQITELDASISRLTERIEEAMQPFRLQRELLTTIPGIATITADVIIAETGGDMAPFPDAAHLASWAGVCPGRHESAGRQKRVGVRPGNRYLKDVLGLAALNTIKASDSHLARRYRRIAKRRGGKRALVATEHAILTAIWNMLARGEAFTDLQPPPPPDPDRVLRNHIRSIERLGYSVTLAPAA